MFERLHILWRLSSLVAQAREGNMDTASAVTLAQLLIPIVVPLVLAGLKRLAPSLPSLLLPVLAPFLGALSAGLTVVTDLGTGAVLGAAGVGVREVVDQSRKAITKPAATP